MSGVGAQGKTRDAKTGRSPRAGVPRAERTLRERGDFEAALRSGTRFATRNFVMRARRNEYNHARLGIIAGRKAAPRAVDRNRAKRLIREAFNAALGRFGAYDVTVQLRGDLRGEVNSGIRAELERLLESLARLAPPETQPVRQ